MTYTNIAHHRAVFDAKPKGAGWKAHKGAKPPIIGDVYVELVHRVVEQGIDGDAFVISRRRKASLIRVEEWALSKDEPGAITAWRLAPEIKPEPAFDVEAMRATIDAMAAMEDSATPPAES